MPLSDKDRAVYGWEWLGIALYRTDDLAGAAKAFETWLKKDPLPPGGSLVYAMTLFRLGKPDVARERYRNTVAWVTQFAPTEDKAALDALAAEAAKLLGVTR